MRKNEGLVIPYKDYDNKLVHSRGYYAGYIRATKDHLGRKCAKCGETENLEIHHKKPLNRRERSWRDYWNLEELELLCKDCHLGEKKEDEKA